MTLKLPDRSRSLLMPLLGTKDTLDVEYLSVRGLWDVPTDVQEAICTGGLEPWGEGWPAREHSEMVHWGKAPNSLSPGWRKRREGGLVLL